LLLGIALTPGYILRTVAIASCMDIPFGGMKSKASPIG
jgi:hypothetical protein